MSGASDFAALRGAVREGVAAIQNLGQLLRSPRVGSRALALALPAVREGTEGLGQALSALEKALRDHLLPGPEAEAARSVLAFAAERARDLERALEAPADRPSPRVGARRRLELEAAVMRALGDLGTVQALIDLFTSTGPPRTNAVDLGEILGEAWSTPRPGPSVEVILDLGADRTFVGDAGPAAAVIELAIAVAAEGARRADRGPRERSRPSPLRLLAARGADGRLVVRLRLQEPPAGEPAPRGPAAREGVRASLRAAIPPLAAALAPAARRAGFEVTLSDDQGEVTITL